MVLSLKIQLKKGLFQNKNDLVVVLIELLSVLRPIFFKISERTMIVIKRFDIVELLSYYSFLIEKS